MAITIVSRPGEMTREDKLKVAAYLRNVVNTFEERGHYGAVRENLDRLRATIRDLEEWS